MDEQRRRISEDLSGTLTGEFRCDPLAVAMYASDGSLYQIPPLGVAYPKDHDDVVALARYSAEMHIPLIPRGAGTGVAGQSLGSGIVVDFSRHMRNIESIEEETVRVQPGVVRDELNRVLHERGRYFPPDPSNSAVTTIGSMLAVDAAGSRSVRVGSTRDHVKSIEIVLAGGHRTEFGNESLDILKSPPGGDGAAGLLDGSPLTAENGNATVKRTIISKLVKLLSDNESLIAERQPPMIRNCSGYYLRGLLSEGRLQAARLLVGSEGTLGLFTAARLHTAPLPECRGIVLLLFGRLEAATSAVQSIAQQQPSACDLLDRRLLSLGRESDPRFEAMISPQAEAGLIVEQTGFSSRQARDRIRMVVECVRSQDPSAVVAHEAYTYEDVEFLWSLPGRVVPLLTRLTGVTRPQPFVEDIAVPPEILHEFLVRAQKTFQKHEVTASLYAHAAAGQLHLRPFLPPPTTSQDGSRIEALARDLYDIAFSVGGSISGEHGDGLARTAFIRAQYGPLYRVFQQVKDIFDPHNLMNPGKIISDDPHVTVRNFRPPPVTSPETVELQLQWAPDELSQTAATCNGCGICRTRQPHLRMCPFFRADPVEDASPRAKANIMRNLTTGMLSPQDIASPEMKRLADLCFNCKQCQLECPSHVNIPHMAIEAKAAYVSAEGLRRADWILSRAHSFGALGCSLSMAANWVIGNPAARWLLEKILGIHRRRKLPAFARRTFLQSVQSDVLKRAEKREPRPVVYFVDHFANYHDPELGRAFLAIMKHHEIPVYVPPEQSASGMAMISAGDLDAAQKLAERNVRELVELAREGLPIVCTEPAAALCLRHEYPRLLDHPDIGVLADQVIEAGAFLGGLHREGRLRTDLAALDLDVGYHTPCHLKALGAETPLRQLLGLIPELRVHTIDRGCSGMAGAYGLTARNFETSLRIGAGLISRMQAADLTVGTTECSSCKIQMEQGTNTATVHPLKLLALSYGLMPEIAERLKPSSRKLVVT